MSELYIIGPDGPRLLGKTDEIEFAMKDGSRIRVAPAPKDALDADVIIDPLDDDTIEG